MKLILTKSEAEALIVSHCQIGTGRLKEVEIIDEPKAEVKKLAKEFDDTIRKEQQQLRNS